MKVLIADDEKDMLKILKAYFEREGFHVFLAEDGEEALTIFYSNKINLAILDWMMPKVNGLQVCKEIKSNSDTKVLMLTAKSENEDELAALKIGADDYVRKPFHPGILLARAKKLLRKEKIVQLKDIKIDLEAKKIYKKEKNLNATKTEFELLRCFLNHKGSILTRKKLLDIVWGFDYFGEERTVDTHIRRLRDKIGEGVIKTHRGLGYSLEEEDE
ncbi:response regulator transcription factor [Peribacillus simplex]|uniref:response regulator transcription factor n=1 Tax=Peribacillus simplex TaxID=1478 RepID=UPI001D4288AF|nr:response regulator transcription factor [Peribacillus simplex]MED3912505.1 response regulator transcription factor [Peribacillus simplex]MED3987550.1 response regulator transcription factor [Peribacillus simplex]MED4096893.1 response regulator transcription factor [Peribacillus simplex]CAH0320499.1 Alkaline phosphatase synthesis transcriptional regulatory protein PhoP [Peribacillus simplex]